MNVSVILAHPDPASFNHALAKSVVDQLIKSCIKVNFHDLYLEQFPSELPAREISKNIILPAVIQLHCDEIAQADGIIIIHPNWWGQPPAILKGWVDRVMRPGVAYKFIGDDKGEGIPQGLLKARVALVLNTSNTGETRENQVFGDPLETIWKNCIFGLCGVTNFHRQVFRVMVTSTPEERRQWLKEAEAITRQVFPQST